MKTILTMQEPGKTETYQCGIDACSRFTTMKWTQNANMSLPENQLKAAREQREGWKNNGPHAMGTTYRIYQGSGGMNEQTWEGMELVE